MKQSTIHEDSSEQEQGQRFNFRPRLIAFFLTQFHPIPENDAWWGKGFTEWTNVAKAKPLFDGHHQPRLPTDFGYYDLRVRATRLDQIRAAKQNGIYGFCYHYYWFSGTRLLNLPLDEMLADPDSDMPFCLCWANENWTRRWDAAEHEILIAQRYLEDDDLNFIKGLIPFFSDPRYIRIDSVPFLIVYRPQHLPDPRKTAGIWREYCRSIGLGEIHLCAALTHGNEDYVKFGFDSGMEFPPHNLNIASVTDQVLFYEPFGGHVFEYSTIARAYLERKYLNKNVFRGVIPSWDNTPRTGSRGIVVTGSTPSDYEYWLSESINKTIEDFPNQRRYVFINAWNEWAEGCSLEPDRKFKDQFLQATFRASKGSSSVSGFGVAVVPARYETKRTFAQDIYRVFVYHIMAWLGRLAIGLKRFPLIRRIVRAIFNVRFRSLS